MIRGTTHDQDSRFANKTQKMLIKSQWPDKYDTKIDLNKVDYELIKVWIQKRITKLLGEEDDIVSGTIISHLDQSLEKQQKLNAKLLHVAISGVLQDKTLTFMSQFWDILDQAQKSARGIPECLVEEKKKSEQLHRKKLDELQGKRHKMNVNRFNQNMRNSQYDSERTDRRDYEYRRSRSPSFRKKKHRERERRKRSRSKSHHKKRRSPSYDRHERKRRDRSYQRDKERRRQKRRNHRASEDSSYQQKKAYKNQPRNSSRDSDSSDVVSSSNSGN